MLILSLLVTLMFSMSAFAEDKVIGKGEDVEVDAG